MTMRKHLIPFCLYLAFICAGNAQEFPFGESRRAGADYATFSNRLPTVKLSDAEALNLITTIHAVLDSGEIKRADVAAAMVRVFGDERAAEYLRLFDARQRGARWSRRENVAVIAALYPVIPGETEDAKADWLIQRAAPCFTAERWSDVIFPYVLERVEEYKAAGGTLERWPEVIEPAPDPEPELSEPLDLSNVVWLHKDVSAWPITATLSASVSTAGTVTLTYDKSRSWGEVDGAVANPWIFVELDGQWYGATWEWLRPGQQSKQMGGKSWGGHIKRAPLSSWEPKSGERVFMMVSGLARSGTKNVAERSNLSEVVFP
jgi:hypothetical protein